MNTDHLNKIFAIGNVTITLFFGGISMFFVTSVVSAQSRPPYKNEIGINLLQAHKIERPHRYFHEKKKPFHLFNGIQYKRRFDHSALRLSLGYVKHPYEEQGTRYYVFQSKKYEYFEAKIGYEKQFGGNKLIPYWALDAFYHRDVYVGAGEVNHWSHSKSTTESKTSTLGISPTFGLRYYFLSRFSLTLESGLSFYNLRTKNQYKSTQLIDTSEEFMKNSRDDNELTGMQFNLLSSFVFSYIF